MRSGLADARLARKQMAGRLTAIGSVSDVPFEIRQIFMASKTGFMDKETCQLSSRFDTAEYFNFIFF